MTRHFLIIICILFIGCKEEFLLDFGDNEKILVINGSITNEPGPYTVNLSLSSKMVNSDMEPYGGCNVKIYDNKGHSELLTEKSAGEYVSDINGIQGEIGTSYKLLVISSDGKEYETTFQEMQEPIDIDSLYGNVETKEVYDDPVGLKGYQFYVNTKESPKKENYFLWQISESYEYTADFTLFAIEDYSGFYLMNQDILDPNFDHLYRCWETEKVHTIYTAETSSLTSSVINKQKLNFVGANSRRLSIRYSMNLRQFTINQEAYLFWKNIEDQISEENPLYASQPGNIIGNLINKQNPDETTFGFFTVASVKERRTFVNRPIDVPISYEVCFVNIDERTMRDLHDENGVVYFVLNEDDIMGSIKKSCFDCRNIGGELSKPDFWIE